MTNCRSAGDDCETGGVGVAAAASGNVAAAKAGNAGRAMNARCRRGTAIHRHAIVMGSADRRERCGAGGAPQAAARVTTTAAASACSTSA